MRKEYGKALRALFANEMKARFPFLKEEKVRSYYLFPGQRPYLWQPPGEVRRWVVLSQDMKGYDEFDLLVGWSRLGRYPELSMVPVCSIPPSEARAEDEYLCSLSSLWTERDAKWKVRVPQHLRAQVPREGLGPIPADVAKEVVRPLVQDALDKLESHGVPYLEALLEDSDVQSS